MFVFHKIRLYVWKWMRMLLKHCYRFFFYTFDLNIGCKSMVFTIRRGCLPYSNDGSYGVRRIYESLREYECNNFLYWASRNFSLECSSSLLVRLSNEDQKVMWSTPTFHIGIQQIKKNKKISSVVERQEYFALLIFLTFLLAFCKIWKLIWVSSIYFTIMSMSLPSWELI